LVDQQFSARLDAGSTLSDGEEAVMADAMKTIGHSVKEKPADELSCIERHFSWPATMAIVASAERRFTI